MDHEVFWFLIAWLAAFVIVIYMIAADKKRFLARFDLSLWQDRHYLQTLPNFLQSLHDHHFKTPWPYARNAVAASHFTFRAWTLRRRSSSMRRRFVRQHIVLFALLDVYKPYIRDFILNERQRIIGNRILEMEDTGDRDKLLAFLDLARAHRAAFFRSLTSYDRNILADMIDRRFIPNLKIAHAIFQEHGYSLLPELTQIREWDSLTGSELAQDLPSLPAIKPIPATKSSHAPVSRSL